jgi:hypothetical protein
MNVKHLVRPALMVGALLAAPSVWAGSLEQAKRIHDRLTGIPPTEAMLLVMKESIEQTGNGRAAAEMAMENDAFYRITLKNWVAPWTNRDQTPFVSLNDYIATVMGLVRDERDFREVLFDDVIYTASGVSPAYSASNNAHYEALETGSVGGVPYVYKDRLQRQLQSSVTGLPAEATAGVITSRAAAKAFFIAGTNRAQLRFTLMNHLCRDLEQVQDVTLIPDRIRQDVSRSPGGDARAFLNGCIGCHNGMDPLAQAFAYYDFAYNSETDLSGENGRIAYNGPGDEDEDTKTRVKKKYHINSATFSYGFVTLDDRWDNYWRTGMNAQLGWDETLPGGGHGAKSMGQELAYSRAFAECQVDKVFRAVCLRQPEDATDRAAAAAMTAQFAADNYRLKTVFAASADYCKGD